MADLVDGKWQGRARYAVLTGLTVIFQVSIAGRIAIGGVHPDVALLMTSMVGLVAGPQRATVTGFWLGLLTGTVSPAPLGLWAGALAVVGYSCGVAEESISTQTRVGVAIFAAAASVGGTLLKAFISELVGLGTMGIPGLPRIIGTVALLNAVLSVGAVHAAMWVESGPTNLPSDF